MARCEPGPARRRAFYFIAGFTPEEFDDDRHHAPQYFLKSLAEAGWDIVYARVPRTWRIRDIPMRTGGSLNSSRRAFSN